MNTTKQTFVICIILGTIGLLTFAGTVEAGLRAEDITGAAEYALTDALQWQPLTREVVLVAGNHIRTGKNGAVGLKGDDGSVLYLEKDTRLAIAALEFSKADQKRISHFKLFQGKLTAKAAVVNFEQDAFKIETNTVVTQFRFPSLTISEPVTESPAQNAGAETVATVVVPQTATSSASSQIFPVEGDFDLQQKNTGETQVIMKVSSDAGVKFSMLKQDSLTTVGIQNKRQKVWVKSDHPLSKMSFFTDHVYNTVRVTNRENSHQCEVTVVKDKVYIMEPGSLLSIAGGSIHEYFAEITGTTNVEFVWVQDPSVPPGTIIVNPETGRILYGGLPLQLGVSIVVQGPGGEERVVIPPAPVQEIIRKYVGSPIQPTR
jgi:hypothetical protein